MFTSEAMQQISWPLSSDALLAELSLINPSVLAGGYGQKKELPVLCPPESGGSLSRLCLAPLATWTCGKGSGMPQNTGDYDLLHL